MNGREKGMKMMIRKKEREKESEDRYWMEGRKMRRSRRRKKIVFT